MSPLPDWKVHLFPENQTHRWRQAVWNPFGDEPDTWYVEGTKVEVGPRGECEVTLKSGRVLILHGRDVDPPPTQLEMDF